MEQMYSIATKEQAEAIFVIADLMKIRVNLCTKTFDDYDSETKYLEFKYIGITSDDRIERYRCEPPNRKSVSLGLLVDEMLKFTPKKEIKLNSEYTAVVLRQSQEVKVGCQTFPFSKIEELYKSIKESAI